MAFEESLICRALGKNEEVLLYVRSIIAAGAIDTVLGATLLSMVLAAVSATCIAEAAQRGSHHFARVGRLPRDVVREHGSELDAA